MKKFARPMLALAMTAGLALTGAAAAQAAPVASAPVVQSTTGPGSGGGDQSSPGLCPSCCSAVKYLHYTAEMLVDAVGLQPVLSIIDKPIIHPLVWGPLDSLLGPCGGTDHPEELS